MPQGGKNEISIEENAAWPGSPQCASTPPVSLFFCSVFHLKVVINNSKN